MATASHIIERAFSKIGVRAAETPLEAEEIQNGLDTLNDMLSAWDNDGTLKGVSPVSAAEDEVKAPRYAEGAIKAHLAMRLAGEYRVAITPAMIGDATDLMNSMLSASIDLDNVPLPATLPTGSGNDDWDYGAEREFFPQTSRSNF
jgi:hypothetical protein